MLLPSVASDGYCIKAITQAKPLQDTEQVSGQEIHQRQGMQLLPEGGFPRGELFLEESVPQAVLDPFQSHSKVCKCIQHRLPKTNL